MTLLLSPQSHLIGIAVPDPEVFTDWTKERGFVGSYEELCQNPVRHSSLTNLRSLSLALNIFSLLA